MEIKGNKHDIIRNRKIREKQEKIQETWTPKDNSWQKKARCKLCKDLYVCNNNAEHEVRPWRIEGVAVCARCYFSRGTPELIAIYKMGREILTLAKGGNPLARRLIDDYMRGF